MDELTLLNTGVNTLSRTQEIVLTHYRTVLEECYD